MTARPASCAWYSAERVASIVVLTRDEGMVIGAIGAWPRAGGKLLDPMAQPGAGPATVSEVMPGHQPQRQRA